MPLLEMTGIRKSFPGVRALDGVNLTLGAGEVVALVGENGAGKSTLIKVLGGIHPPDAGEVRIDGSPVRFAGAADALSAGVSVIHQELVLAENLDIAENIHLGREPTKGRWGRLDRRRLYDDAKQWMARVGLDDVSPDTPVEELSVGRKQMVEIAKALSRSARILVMDEPTAALSQRESERLFAVIEELRRKGVGILYVSHRLAEVVRLANRVCVLRDGKNAGELTGAEMALPDNIIRLMVGRDLNRFYARHAPTATSESLLQVRNLAYAGSTAPASFELRAGEILGVAGLVGAGRTELAEALFGIRPITAGEIRVRGTPVTIRKTDDALAAGIALVPEDRKLQGLVMSMDIRRNIGLPQWNALPGRAWLPARRERAIAVGQIDRLRIRATGPDQEVQTLSGGNQQKVVLGKWLARSPAVLILDEPTRGIDVGAKGEIYALMAELAGAGVGILMISSDLEEVVGMSDRVMVLHQGRIAGTLDRGAIDEQSIMRLATGFA